MTMQILEGLFARVFDGNGNWRWMLEGDDLQARANATIDRPRRHRCGQVCGPS